MKILHINTFDVYGGAERIAYDLTHFHGVESTLLVRDKFSDSDSVIEFPKYITDRFFKFCDSILWNLGIRKKFRQIFFIGEECNFTYKKLSGLKEYQECEVVHLHNIHGGYFDLDALVPVSKEKKIVWTLQDMWLMTGGEAHTFENENYKKGKGKTPYINLYPLNNPIIDRRQYFMERKRKIINEISLNTTFVAVSKWLENCFKSSYVYNEKINSIVINNFVDTELFKNYNKRKWNKPRILIFNNASPFRNPSWAINQLKNILAEFELYIVGEKTNLFPVTFHLDFVSDKNKLSEIYNQVDILIFPSLADSCPLTILEAMACGVYVIASNAGGIPELISNEQLFKVNDEKDLIKKTDNAINNINATREIAKVSSVEAVRNYDLKIKFKDYRMIYHQL